MTQLMFFYLLENPIRLKRNELFKLFTLQIHQTNSEQVPQYAKIINDLYMSTSTVHTQAEMAKQNADKLFDDVTEAESKS